MMNQNFKKQKNFFYLLGFVIFLLVTIAIVFIFFIKKQNISELTPFFVNGKKMTSQEYEAWKKDLLYPSKHEKKEYRKTAYDFVLVEFGTKPLKANSFQDYADKFCQTNEKISREASYTPFTFDKSEFNEIKFYELNCNYAEYFKKDNTLEEGHFIQLDLYKNDDEVQESLSSPIDRKYDSIYFHDGISQEGGNDSGSRYLIKSGKVKSFDNYDVYIYLESESFTGPSEPYLRAVKTFKHGNGFTYYMSYTRKLFADWDIKNLEFSDACKGQRDNYKCVEVNAVKVFKEKYLNSNDPEVVDALAKIDKVMNAIEAN